MKLPREPADKTLFEDMMAVSSEEDAKATPTMKARLNVKDRRHLETHVVRGIFATPYIVMEVHVKCAHYPDQSTTSICRLSCS